MSVNDRDIKSYFVSGSWRSGLGFNALIHAHRPDLIDFTKLSPQKHIDNLNHAFDVAQNELGVPRLLDAEGKLCLLLLDNQIYENVTLTRCQ
jgi:hypothetical protein